MSSEFFIANRIYKGRAGGKQVSPPAIRIAVGSIALGLAVIILSVAIVIGFKQEVRGKVVGFGSHIQVSNFGSNNSYETEPISISDSLLKTVNKSPNINHIQKFATKPGIIKTDEAYIGVILKGIDTDFNWDFFKQHLKSGKILTFPTEGQQAGTNVILSQYIADKLNLKLGDSFLTYFFQNETRVRKFKITGIYETNFIEYDKLFVLADIRQIRKLNQWEDDLASGLEITVRNYEQLDQTTMDLYLDLQATKDRLGNTFYTRSIKQLNPGIFTWLGILDTNVVVILIIMLAVAGFSMISGLLIIILERTSMIGILKAMGEDNASIRKIFLYVSFFLIGKGLLWGNLVALSICLIQKQFGFLKLDPNTYYISQVPIALNIWHVILLNLCTLFVSMLMLIGPSYLVSRISPAKSMRFD